MSDDAARNLHRGRGLARARKRPRARAKARRRVPRRHLLRIRERRDRRPREQGRVRPVWPLPGRLPRGRRHRHEALRRHHARALARAPVAKIGGHELHLGRPRAVPVGRPALLAIDANGERRVWHFGELIAMSAGVSGALAARGVGARRCRHDPRRQPDRVGADACSRPGGWARSRCRCRPSSEPGDLEHRVAVANPALCVGEEELLASMPGGVECMTMADMEAVLDEDRPQETPASIADLAPSDPALIVFTSGTTGEPRAALHTASYLPAQRGQAENWVGSNKDDLVWVTTATGWSKSARNVFVAPWLTGAAALICDARFDPAERLALCEREGVSVLCQAPTEYRMLAAKGELRPMPSLRRAISAGEPLGSRHAGGLPRGVGPSRSPTATARPRRATSAATTSASQVKPGSMGKPLPGTQVRIADGELQVRAATCPTFFSGYIGDEGSPEPDRRRVVGHGRPRARGRGRATSSTRAAPTT